MNSFRNSRLAGLTVCALLLSVQPARPQEAGKSAERAVRSVKSESSRGEKEDMYERFLANYQENTCAAYEAGKEFLRVYEAADGPDNPQVKYLKKWVGVFERLAQDPVKACAAADMSTRVYSPREVAERAKLIFKPEPFYAYEARVHGTHGPVDLRVVLHADGKVTNIKVLSGQPHGLTESAVKAAGQITFTPALKDGRPVSQFIRITYNFNLP